MTVGASFSSGHIAPNHDFRRTRTPNVDSELSKDNVYLVDNLHGKTVTEYTNDKMQPIIDEYNAKQKRKDRKINDNYADYFRKQPKNRGRSLSMEYVAQYGEHRDLGGEYYSPDTSPERKVEIRNEYITVYTKLLKNIQKKYPHMEVLYAIIHFDEPNGTPHLHLGVQPIGECYAKGLSKQISISKALTLDGIEKLKTRSEAQREGGFQLARFYNHVRHEEFEPILAALGYDFKEPMHGRKHEEPSLFAAGMAEIDSAKAAIEAQRDAVILGQQMLTVQREALDCERKEQQNLAEADMPPEIVITKRKAKVEEGKKAILTKVKMETVATVDPIAVREMEENLRATKAELKKAKKEITRLQALEASIKKIFSVLLDRKESQKLTCVWNICRELPPFIQACKDRDAKESQQIALMQAQEKASEEAAKRYAKKLHKKNYPKRQSRRVEWIQER